MWHIIAKAVIYTAVPIIIREITIYIKDRDKDEPKPPIKRKTDDRRK